MLIGEYTHTLDAKGRVNFPSRLREDLGEGFIVSKGLGNRCLNVYSLQEWDKLSQKINNLPISKAGPIQRFLFSGAYEAQPDKQGRIVIPAGLREYAGLNKDVTIVGASTRAEIWSTEEWKATQEMLTPELIAEAMEELGF